MRLTFGRRRPELEQFGNLGKCRKLEKMAKSIETLKPHISGLHRSNVKCFTIFPHKIQLPIDLNRFRIQKSGFGENPDFPEFKKPDFSRGRQRLIFSNTVSEWPWSGDSKTVRHILITRTLVTRGLGPV